MTEEELYENLESLGYFIEELMSEIDELRLEGKSNDDILKYFEII